MCGAEIEIGNTLQITVPLGWLMVSTTTTTKPKWQSVWKNCGLSFSCWTLHIRACHILKLNIAVIFQVSLESSCEHAHNLFFLPPFPPIFLILNICLLFLFFSIIRALAASAPIWQFSGLAHCQSFYDTASDVFNDTSQACHDNLRLGWYTLSAIGEGAGQRSATPPHPNPNPTLILHPSAFPRPQWCPELLHSVDSGFCTSTATLLFKDNDWFCCCWYFIVSCGKFGSPYLGKVQQPQEWCYPFLSVCAVFSCVQTMAWEPVLGISNVHTDVDVCNNTQGLYRHCING